MQNYCLWFSVFLSSFPNTCTAAAAACPLCLFWHVLTLSPPPCKGSVSALHMISDSHSPSSLFHSHSLPPNRDVLQADIPSTCSKWWVWCSPLLISQKKPQTIRLAAQWLCKHLAADAKELFQERLWGSTKWLNLISLALMLLLYEMNGNYFRSCLCFLKV